MASEHSWLLPGTILSVLTTPLFICLGKFSFHFSYSIRFMAYSHLAAAYNLFQLGRHVLWAPPRAGPCATGWGCGAQDQGSASNGHRLSWWPRALCSYPAPSSQDILSCGQQTHGWPRVTCSDLILHMKNMVMQPRKRLTSFLVIFCSSARNSPTAMSFDPYLLSCSLKWASLDQRPWGISTPFPTNHFWTYTHRGERGSLEAHDLIQ